MSFHTFHTPILMIIKKKHKSSESLAEKNHKESKVHCGVMENEVSKHDKNVAP